MPQYLPYLIIYIILYYILVCTLLASIEGWNCYNFVTKFFALGTQ